MEYISCQPGWLDQMLLAKILFIPAAALPSVRSIIACKAVICHKQALQALQCEVLVTEHLSICSHNKIEASHLFFYEALNNSFLY